jgi:actin-like ATPase involved in cell morphogenesis
VISLGSVIESESVRVGGDVLDELRTVLDEPLSKIVATVERGLVRAGGGALLLGLAERL